MVADSLASVQNHLEGLRGNPKPLNEEEKRELETLQEKFQNADIGDITQWTSADGARLIELHNRKNLFHPDPDLIADLGMLGLTDEAKILDASREKIERVIDKIQHTQMAQTSEGFVPEGWVFPPIEHSVLRELLDHTIGKAQDEVQWHKRLLGNIIDCVECGLDPTRCTLKKLRKEQKKQGKEESYNMITEIFRVLRTKSPTTKIHIGPRPALDDDQLEALDDNLAKIPPVFTEERRHTIIEGLKRLAGERCTLTPDSDWSNVAIWVRNEIMRKAKMETPDVADRSVIDHVYAIRGKVRSIFDND